MLELTPHLSDTVCAPWRADPVEVWHLYDALTQRGWKIDTEESNLMHGLSRTWPEHGVKVWIYLKKFVCAPPDDDVECLDTLHTYRFDPAVLPRETMEEKMYTLEDLEADWYPGHREEWDWLVENGDPNSDDGAWLTPTPLGDLPPEVRAVLAADLVAAIRYA